jgi:hypothetical protein
MSGFLREIDNLGSRTSKLDVVDAASRDRARWRSANPKKINQHGCDGQAQIYRQLPGHFLEWRRTEEDSQGPGLT